jgi:arylsulfatase A-like enzyme
MEQRAFTRAPLSTDQLEAVRQMYEAEIAFADHEVGRLLDAASSADLVLIVGDHGEEFLDHGGFLHGHTVFEEMLHVPLVFAGPGVRAGNVAAEPVSHVDIAPTILDLLAMPPLKDATGRSLRGQLAGKEAGDDSRVIFAVREYGGVKFVAARRGPWKLIHGEQTRQQALFDLERDPDERVNLVRKNENVARELLAAIEGRKGRIAEAPELDDEELERRRIQELRKLGYVE